MSLAFVPGAGREGATGRVLIGGQEERESVSGETGVEESAED